jgi:intein/homing endonuclease
LETPEQLAAWWREADDRAEVRGQQVSANYESTWYVDRRGPSRIARPNVVREFTIASCLAAGTPIITELGPRAVETIEPGDRVLAQDVETGELAFKPVLGRTIREKAVLQRLRTMGDEMVCSQGHPFWINGIGWVQARALQPGMPLHTVNGAIEVRSVEPAGEGTVYNLIVADAHSYFVGRESPILSHDVTPRAPTNSLVPGLAPLWEAGDDSRANVSSVR